MLESFATYY